MPASPRLRRIDGLRGVCILLVMIGHAGDYTLGMHQVGELAGIGVLVFFIISGYLITTMLDRELGATGRIDFREYYLRRAVRILPAFWLLMAVTITLMVAGFVTDVTWKAVAACLLFLRNIRGRGQSLGHIWSLSLQEQFYVVWPLVLSRIGIRRGLGVALALIMAVTLWRTGAIVAQLYPYETDVFYLRSDFRLDSILVGCALAMLLRDDRYEARVTGLLQRVPLIPTVGALLAWSLTASLVTELRPVFLTVETAIAVLAFGRFMLLDPDAVVVRLCEHAAIVWLGMLSYSLYLWQQLFLVTRDPSWGVLRTLPVSVLCAFAAAIASYTLVERPALRLRARWSRSDRHAPAAVLAR